MEALLDVIGALALILLILIGAAAGFVASLVTGGRSLVYVLIGIAGAVAAPFVLVAVGVTALAAGGVILILLVGAVGAAAVLALVAILRGAVRRDSRR